MEELTRVLEVTGAPGVLAAVGWLLLRVEQLHRTVRVQEHRLTVLELRPPRRPRRRKGEAAPGDVERAA